jgi:hypothetical protein
MKTTSARHEPHTRLFLTITPITDVIALGPQCLGVAAFCENNKMLDPISRKSTIDAE